MSENIRKTPAREHHIGLRCPGCGERKLRVLYTRPRPGGTLGRRRECRHCGKRFTTSERPLGR